MFQLILNRIGGLAVSDPFPLKLAEGFSGVEADPSEQRLILVAF